MHTARRLHGLSRFVQQLQTQLKACLLICRLEQQLHGKLHQLLRLFLTHPSHARGTVAAALVKRSYTLRAEFERLIGTLQRPVVGMLMLLDFMLSDLLCTAVSHIFVCCLETTD